MADWDGRLLGGGKFTLILTAKAINNLKTVGADLPSPEFGYYERLNQLCEILKGRGVRVTGQIHARRSFNTDYLIVVDDPDHFKIND